MLQFLLLHFSLSCSFLSSRNKATLVTTLHTAAEILPECVSYLLLNLIFVSFFFFVVQIFTCFSIPRETNDLREIIFFPGVDGLPGEIEIYGSRYRILERRAMYKF